MTSPRLAAAFPEFGLIRNDELRAKRGKFVSRFAAEKPYFMIRAATPQLLFAEAEKLL